MAFLVAMDFFSASGSGQCFNFIDKTIVAKFNVWDAKICATFLCFVRFAHSPVITAVISQLFSPIIAVSTIDRLPHLRRSHSIREPVANLARSESGHANLRLCCLRSPYNTFLFSIQLQQDLNALVSIRQWLLYFASALRPLFSFLVKNTMTKVLCQHVFDFLVNIFTLIWFYRSLRRVSRRASVRSSNAISCLRLPRAQRYNVNTESNYLTNNRLVRTTSQRARQRRDVVSVRESCLNEHSCCSRDRLICFFVGFSGFRAQDLLRLSARDCDCERLHVVRLSKKCTVHLIEYATARACAMHIKFIVFHD